MTPLSTHLPFGSICRFLRRHAGTDSIKGIGGRGARLLTCHTRPFRRTPRQIGARAPRSDRRAPAGVPHRTACWPCHARRRARRPGLHQEGRQPPKENDKQARQFLTACPKNPTIAVVEARRGSIDCRLAAPTGRWRLDRPTCPQPRGRGALAPLPQSGSDFSG
jgi:hypothetical protein